MPTKAVSSTPKYRALAESLRLRIASGDLKPGDRLPSFAEMRAQQGITQPTMERAHALLERDGLIRREQGRGTFVLDPAAPPAPSRSLSLMGHTVAILTADEQGASQYGHRYSGWREYITGGAVDAARDARLHALTVHPDRLDEAGLADLVAAQPAGIAVMEIEGMSGKLLSTIETLASSGIPLALYGNPPEFAGHDRVTSDQEAGANALTRWMIAAGRRRILQVWPAPADGYWYAERLAGYRRAMEEAGLEPLSPLLVPLHVPDYHGRERFEHLSRAYAGYLAGAVLGADPCDAILASSDGDVFAIGAACRLLQRDPGRDILIAGYDNYWQESDERDWEATVPAVTIDKDNRALGAALIELLRERASSRLPDGPQHRRIAPKLVVTPA